MSKIVLKIENVAKQYRLGMVGTGTISHDLKRWWYSIRRLEDPYIKLGSDNKHEEISGDYVWALKDINLEIKKGEVIGIIGKNGAGKSTLLKLLSQVTSPTSGTIKIKGRIASLLEVGTGFHQELTGRENVFLNGAILGMTKKEIGSKFNEIVSFSGIGKYIDTPVKRYSSGMMVRLGFAVAAHLDPEILVVDEVLAVGDADFQKKCLGKMKDVSNQGRTVVFVSHNMTSIRNLCSKGVLIKNGKIDFIGDVDKTISNYLKGDKSNKKVIKTTIDSSLSTYSTGDAKFKNAYLSNDLESQTPLNILHYQEPFFIHTNLLIAKKLSNVCVSYKIVNEYGEVITNSYSYNRKELLSFDVGSYTITFKSSLFLLPGNYALSFSIFHFYTGESIDLIEYFNPFRVLKESLNGEKEYPWETVKGYVEMDEDWIINKNK